MSVVGEQVPSFELDNGTSRVSARRKMIKGKYGTVTVSQMAG